MSDTEHVFADTNRHLVEVPDSFAIARWPRDADSAAIARCILGTLKYEPHTGDITAVRHALEACITTYEMKAQTTRSPRATEPSAPTGETGRRTLTLNRRLQQDGR
jgi:hypothetical protein